MTSGAVGGQLFTVPTLAPITFTVPGEPVAWARARQRVITPKGGGAPFASFFLSAEQKARQQAIAVFARAAGVRLAQPDEPLGLDVVASWSWPSSWTKRRLVDALLTLDENPTMLGVPKTTRPDADNLAKEVGDALNGIAWEDDAQVVIVRSAKVWAREADAGTHVRIWRATTPDAPPLVPWWRRGRIS